MEQLAVYTITVDNGRNGAATGGMVILGNPVQNNKNPVIVNIRRGVATNQDTQRMFLADPALIGSKVWLVAFTPDYYSGVGYEYGLVYPTIESIIEDFRSEGAHGFVNPIESMSTVWDDPDARGSVFNEDHLRQLIARGYGNGVIIQEITLP